MTRYDNFKITLIFYRGRVRVDFMEESGILTTKHAGASSDSFTGSGSKSSSLNSKLGHSVSAGSQSSRSKGSNSPSKSICSSSSTSTENLPLAMQGLKVWNIFFISSLNRF